MLLPMYEQFFQPVVDRKGIFCMYGFILSLMNIASDAHCPENTRSGTNFKIAEGRMVSFLRFVCSRTLP